MSGFDLECNEQHYFFTGLYHSSLPDDVLKQTFLEDIRSKNQTIADSSQFCATIHDIWDVYLNDLLDADKRI